MSDEMWRSLVLLLFFAPVPVSSYWFVLRPDRWTTRWRERVHDGGRNEEGKEEGP